MAWTQTDLDAINAAIATGATRVRFQTHEVEYQTSNELLRVRDAIMAELNPNATNNRTTFAEYYSGY
jgi:hypothetical protein